jgi:transposase
MTDIIIMSKKELDKVAVIRDLVNRRIKSKEAAKFLNLSARQIRRLKNRFKKFGGEGLIHQNRGQIGHNRLSDELLAKTKRILEERYPDFWPSHAQEKLSENHGLKISKEKIRQIMIESRLWIPRKDRLKAHYRSWRDRKEYFGEMQQYDGSFHDWFEGRLPKCTLLASIDDATGQVTHARFAADEGVLNTFAFWREYLGLHGKPLNIYLDRYSTYKINTRDLKDDPDNVTQFERAMKKDLNITIIHARSPEAKGRIERLFKTLQNRLGKELRLAKVNSIVEANQFLQKQFLPYFNRKFPVLAKKPGNLHRPVTKEELWSLGSVFSIQTPRKVNNDFTVSLKGAWYQLLAEQPVLIVKKDAVIMEEHLDDTISIRKGNKHLNFSRLPSRPVKVQNIPIIGLTPRRQFSWKPPVDHPWRKRFLAKPVEALVNANLINSKC